MLISNFVNSYRTQLTPRQASSTEGRHASDSEMDTTNEVRYLSGLYLKFAISQRSHVYCPDVLRYQNTHVIRSNLGTVNTFLVRFGSISGSFVLAMNIWARRLRLAKIRTTAQSNSPNPSNLLVCKALLTNLFCFQ